jgi:hypothetical protein
MHQKSPQEIDRKPFKTNHLQRADQTSPWPLLNYGANRALGPLKHPQN